MAIKNVTGDALDQLVPYIIEDLKVINGKNAIKQIANKYKLDPAVVRSISKSRSIGQIKSTKQNVENVVSKEETEVVKSEPKKGKGRRLTDDEKIRILELRESGMSSKEISETVGVSYPTVRRVCLAFGVDESKPRSSKKEDKQLKTESESSSENINLSEVGKLLGLDKIGNLKEVKSSSDVECGLIADRHDMPVNKYVFNTFDDDLMFDYKRQEEIAKRFILQNIEFSEIGEPKQQIILYASGLQCAMATVIKMCYKLGVNLKIKHYNLSTKAYDIQTIYNHFSCNTENNIYAKFLNLKRSNLYLYNCDENNITDNCELYTITLSEFNNDKQFVGNVDTIVFDKYDEMWSVYAKLISMILSHKEKYLGVFINNSYIKNGEFVWGPSISKGYNFK